jgi:hypothetical protein
MTASVKVTVVIPVYNRGKYVGEAIKSFVSNNGRASAVKALHRATRSTIRRQVKAQRTCTAGRQKNIENLGRKPGCGQ